MFVVMFTNARQGSSIVPAQVISPLASIFALEIINSVAISARNVVPPAKYTFLVAIGCLVVLVIAF